MSRKSKLADKLENGKNMSPEKKLQIETNPDNAADNILKYKASII